MKTHRRLRPRPLRLHLHRLLPSLGYTTVNILTAADTVLFRAVRRVPRPRRAFETAQHHPQGQSGLNPALDIEGFLLTMYMRNRLNNQVVNEVREHFRSAGLRHNNSAQYPFGRSPRTESPSCCTMPGLRVREQRKFTFPWRGSSQRNWR